jgi:hypothetical protein
MMMMMMIMMIDFEPSRWLIIATGFFNVLVPAGRGALTGVTVYVENTQ